MKKNSFSILFFLALALFLPSSMSEAHPHVYVDASLTFVVDADGLTSVRQNWLFDDIFSKAILADLGIDEASLATLQGQDVIRKGAFAYLSNYEYFTLIESAGRRVPVRPEGFKASLVQGRLAYEFTVPVNLPLDRLRDFRVAIFDKDYYTDILLMKDDIRFEISGDVKVEHFIRQARDHAYWQYIIPEAVHLTFSNDPASAAVASEPDEEPGLIQSLMNRVRAVQKEITALLNGFAADIQDDPFGPALWMFLGLSFVYGVVHAVGPGHGKAVVCSYFLSNPGSFVLGALMGNVITFVHMSSAAVAVGIAYVLFSSGMGGFQAASRALQPASYGLLVLMGLFLTARAVRDVRNGGLLAETSCRVNADDVARSAHVKRVLTVSFITGLVPCPGAAVILAFSIGLNIFWAGALALVTMAMGMGLTTTLFAWAAVVARDVTLRISGRNRKIFNRVYAGLSVCGAACIAIFGAALFLGSI